MLAGVGKISDVFRKAGADLAVRMLYAVAEFLDVGFTRALATGGSAIGGK